MSGPQKKPRVPSGAMLTVVRLYSVVLGAVLAFGTEVVLFILLGHWLDTRWDCQPWLTIAGSVLGLGLGLYQLVLAVRWLLRNR